jgi:acyl dehydratase
MSESPSFTDFSPGASSPEQRTGPLTRTDFVRYAGAGGDFNPAHHDETFARAAGNETVFGHGLLTAGILARLVQDWLGLPFVRSYGVRFVDRIWPGDTLTARGTVERTWEEDGEGFVECSLEVRREGDRETSVALTGQATAAYPLGGEGAG